MATAINHVAGMDEIDLLRDHLWSQEWFSDPTRRTVSKCRRWLSQLLTTSRWGSTVEALVRLGNAGPHVCVVTNDGLCDICADAAIDMLLTRSLAGVASVDNLDEAAMYVQRTAGPQQRFLLTDTAIADLLDRAIGGHKILRTAGAEAIRERLSSWGELGDSHLGDPRLRAFLPANLPTNRPGVRGAPRSTLEDANLLLTELDRIVGTLIIPAVEVGMDNQERAEAAAFRRSLHATVPTSGLLVLPSPSEVVRRVRMMAQDTGHSDDVDALEWVLEPPAHYRRTDRFDTTVKVAEIVWEAIGEMSGLPYAPYRGTGTTDDHLRNYERLAEIIGVCPSRRQLRLYGRLGRLVAKASVTRSTPRHQNDTLEPDTAQVTTFADVYAILRSYVQKYGTLPSRTALESRLVEEIEAATGMSLKAVVAHANEAYGWQLPAVSETERNLGKLLVQSFPDVAPQGQFHDELFGLRSSIDWYLQTDAAQQAMFHRVEICAEADGSGHFRKVWNWDLAAQRRRDAEKSRRVEKAHASGRDIMLLAVHGDLLNPIRMDAETLRTIIDDAVQRDMFWVFLRPESCTEMRAVHRPASLVDTVDGIQVWALTNQTEQEHPTG